MRHSICLIFVLFKTVFANGQDTVVVYSDYVVYKGDTLNRLDTNGKKTGIWLTLRTDSTYTTTKIDHPPSIYTSPTRPIYRAIAKGQYLNGQRQGKWTFGNNDFKEIHSEVNYKDDKLLSPILFFTTGYQMWLKAEYFNGKWTYYRWDIAKNAYVDTHQKYTFDFLFGAYGYDFNKIR